MGVYADVTNPIIIQATKTLQPKIDNFLRRMCIVSQGGTTLENGQFQIVRSSSYGEILNTQPNNEAAKTELEKKLKGFFAFAGDKELCVLEVGAFNVDSNPISNQVQFLSDYIASKKSQSYIHLVPDAWYYPPERSVPVANTSISCTTSLVGLREAVPESESLPGGVSQPITTEALVITTNIADENLSAVWGQEGIASFDVASKTITAIKEGETTLTLSGKTNPDEGNEASITIKVIVGAWNEELALEPSEETAKDTPVSDITNNPNKTLGRDLAFSNFAKEFASLESKVFFFITMTANEDPSISQGAALYKNVKSVFLVYDNLLNAAYPLSSIVLGICASSTYDLSDTQKGTPLNFKTLDGQTAAQLSSVLATNIIDCPANFGGTLAGNYVLLNGRYADGTAWEYYYFWDTIEFEIRKKLETLLLNGVNSSQNVIPYNQSGLDTLAANIKSVLLLWQSRGVVTNFAKSFDNNTNSMVDVGQISAIDFYTYIANNPEDYANEIYKGFSFYLMIGRFIRQIYIDVTLN